GDDAATTSSKLGALLDRLGSTADEVRTIAVATANLMGLPTTPDGAYSAAEITNAELHWGIRRLVELLAHDRPVVLIFEDLHWAEPTLLELILLIAKGGADAPLLLLVSARPEFLEEHPTFVVSTGYRHVLELEEL